MRENFAILKQWAALERLTFPVNPLLFRVPEPCHAAILDCRTIHERLLARERRTSTLFNNSKNLASSSQEWRPDVPRNTKRPRVKWDENRRIRQHLYHSSKVEVDCKVILVELILTVVWLIDYPRLPISEFHVGKLPDSMEVQSWRVNFKTEVCSKSADPHLTMHWITEVETAKSIEKNLWHRDRFLVRNDFPYYDMLDATIASALKRFLNTQIHFRERASVEEQGAQKYDRF